MPLSIFLKEPKISVFAKNGEPGIEETMGVKMALYAQYDNGESMKIPVDNIAMIQVISDEEIKKIRKESEERKKQLERGGQFSPPSRIFGSGAGGFTPPGKKGRH